MKNDNLIIKPKRPKGDDGYKIFSVTMKQNLQNSQKSANYPYLVQKG